MPKIGTILVIDNNEKNINNLSNIFIDIFSVDIAEVASEAMNMIKQNNYVLIILNVDLSSFEVGDTIKHIKESEITRHIPLIVTTDKRDYEDVALEAGADDVLKIPYSFEAAKRRILNLYERSAMEKKMEESLAEVKYSYNALTYSMPGGIAIYNYKNDRLELLSFNDNLCESLGFTREEFQKTYGIDATMLIHFEDRYQVFKQLNLISYDGDIAVVTHRIVNKFGQIQWVHVNTIKQRQPNGDTWLRAIYVDITKEKEKEAALNKINNALMYTIKHDELTDVYNKNAFCEATEELINNNLSTEYLLMRSNIVGFKSINDIYGEEYGDRVLQVFADDISQYASKRGGTYGRIANDHFVFCLPNSEVLIDNLKQHCKSTLNIYGAEISLTFSVGIYEIIDRKVPVTIMCDRANMALQSIKGSRVKSIAYYEVSMRSEFLREQKITNEAIKAIENQEFEPYFQPIFSYEKNGFAGAEALVRWIKPGRKEPISPGEFIPVLEKNGSIIELDRYVWDKVCVKQRQWLDSGVPVVPISVNVSALHFENDGFSTDFIGMLQKYQLPPELIRVEITESVYARNSEQVQAHIENLQNYGIKILMDDFGSEYSSFTMLKNINVDLMKIDIEFIKDLNEGPRNNIILASIVRMAKWINIPAVAEGVETKEQAIFLKNKGCPFVQGFFFSKPLKDVDFCELLVGGKNDWKLDEVTGNLHDNDIAQDVHMENLELQHENDKIKEKERWQTERYRILIESTRATTFDYNPIDDVLSFNYLNRDNEYKEIVVPDYKLKMRTRETIHKDSIDMYLHEMDEACKVPCKKEFEYLTKIFDDEYKWYKTFYVSLADENGKIYRIVGRVDSVQEKKEQELKTERQRKELLKKASYDAVTGVYNRATIQAMITTELCAYRETQGMLAIYDIDNFKEINDKLGHPVGDRILRGVAEFIGKEFKDIGVVGRIGGDEFVIFVRNAEHHDIIRGMLEECRQGINTLQLTREKMFVTASFGVCFTEKSDKTFDEAFEKADVALYKSKYNGKNQISYYEE